MTPEKAVDAIIGFCWTVSDDLKVDTNVIHNPEKILEIIHTQRAQAVAEYDRCGEFSEKETGETCKERG